MIAIYPFGMGMAGRKYSVSDVYRYGFNGKENDNDVKGEGNQQDYGMRVYDPRLGKFLSVDPLSKKYPELSRYQFASNSPISGIDLDGLEFYYSADGKFLGRGKDPKNMEVRLAKANGVTENGRPIFAAVDVNGNYSRQWTVIHGNHKDFLDRAHMVYGEGGNNGVNADGSNPARYFAFAFENFKQKGLKEPQNEEEAKNRTWKDAESSYKDGTIQTAGAANSPYNLFNNARKKVESGAGDFGGVPNAENAIASVIAVLLKTETDPTNGAYQWVGVPGNGDNNDTWKGKVANRIATAKVNTSSKYYKSVTIFYRFKTSEEKKQLIIKSNDTTKASSK